MTDSEGSNGAGAGVDPRTMITPDAFRVSEQLYGWPLATPARRAAAIVLDALVVAVLSSVAGWLLVLPLGVMAWAWWTARKTPDAPMPLPVRRVIRATALVILAVLVLSWFDPGPWADRSAPDDDVDSPSASLDLGPADAISFAAHVASFMSCEDAACRSARFPAVADVVNRSNTSEQKRREALRELAREAADNADEQRALMALLDGLQAGASQSTEHDTEAGAEVQPDFAERMFKAARGIIQEAGANFGWGAVYFTLLTYYWQGQTLGKRWMGIRVVVLSGRPIGIAAAFERYGGYAAGFATGLLGFLQVFWDPNRQAIHDKVAFTAVVIDGAAPDTLNRGE